MLLWLFHIGVSFLFQIRNVLFKIICCRRIMMSEFIINNKEQLFFRSRNLYLNRFSFLDLSLIMVLIPLILNLLTLCILIVRFVTSLWRRLHFLMNFLRFYWRILRNFEFIIPTNYSFRIFRRLNSLNVDFPNTFCFWFWLNFYCLFWLLFFFLLRGFS